MPASLPAKIDSPILAAIIHFMTRLASIDFQGAFGPGSAVITERWGFRLGDKGTHTSRTIMLKELTMLLDVVPGQAGRADYAHAVLEGNCLAKRTSATRKLSLQRLSELYGLDPAVPLFRILRDIWGHHESSRPLLALLTALARDPLLRASAPTILGTPVGEELSRKRLTDDLVRTIGHRMNESIIDKVARNAASSWAQAGHLSGRVRKIRQRVQPTPAACAFALALGYLLGRRGPLLFETPWAAVLDTPPAELINLAADAKRLGLLELKQSGSIVDVSFPELLGRLEG